MAALAFIAPAGFAEAKDPKPTQLTLRYFADGGPSPASVSADKLQVSKASVSDGETFVVSNGGRELGSATKITIGGRLIDIHTSCSAPIAVGYVYNDGTSKPAPDATSIQGYNGPPALEIVGLQPPNACGNTPPTPTPTPTPTKTPTPTPTKSPTPTPPPDLRCPIGTARLIISGTNDATYTDYTFTVTVTYTNAHYLDFRSNLGVRELLVYGSGGTARYQFDPAIKQGSRFQSLGGHTIQKAAFCYVKPTATPTPKPTPTPTPKPTPTTCPCPTPTPKPTPTPCPCPPGTTVVLDKFERTTSNTWGSASLGGAYAHSGTTSNYGVNNGAGLIVNPTGASRSALLNSVSQRDVEIKFRVMTNKVATGGARYAYGVVRRVGNNEYRPRLILNANCTVSVNASVVINGIESSLGSPTVVPNASSCNWIWLRAQIVGGNPTTIRIKAWQAGQAEPSNWQWTRTVYNKIATAGSVGLRTYVSSSVTNGPINFRFDDFRVICL